MTIKARDSHAFSFYPNLKPYTFNRGPGNRRFDGYLLSREYLADLAALGHEAVTEGRALFLDNGLLDDGRKIGRDAVLDDATQAADVLTRWLRATEAEERLPLAATEVLGPEDLWSALQLERGLELDEGALERLDAQASWARAWNDRLGARVQVFVPVHVATYAQAYDAGRVLGRHGVAVALPLTRALQSRRWTESITTDEVTTWTKVVPAAYLEATVVLLGVMSGYRETAGRAPRLHALGLGTPIMLPIVAAAACATGSVITTDSMAPINDAMTEPTTSLYVETPAPLKYKAFKIAQAWIEKGMPWGCPCPFCDAIEARYPSNPVRAREKWLAGGAKPLSKDDLLSAGPYSEDFPLLSWSRNATQHAAVGIARTNHNLWVLQRVEQHIRQLAMVEGSLRAWVDGLVTRHGQAADPSWGRAAQLAWDAVQRWLDRG